MGKSFVRPNNSKRNPREQASRMSMNSEQDVQRLVDEYGLTGVLFVLVQTYGEVSIVAALHQATQSRDRAASTQPQNYDRGS